MRAMGEGLVDQHGRSLSNASATSYTAAQLDQFFRSTRVTGGSASNPYEQISSYYACITIIAIQFATLIPKNWTPSPGTRGRKPNYQQVFPSDLVQKLDRPEPQLSGVRWRMQWATKLLDGGTVVCVKRGMGADGLPELKLYGMDDIGPVRKGVDGPLIGWQLRQKAGRPPESFDLTQTMHWSLPNPCDDVLGMAPKHVLRATLDADFARELYDRSYYRKGANPSGILRNKYRLSPDQRQSARRAYEEAYGGPDNAGKMMLLDGEWDYTPLTFMHSQSQYAEVRKLTREMIAASFFGFPVGFLNSQEAGGLSRAGEEADRLKLYENCVFPLARLFEPEFNYRFVEEHWPRVTMAFDTRQVPVALTYAKAESEILANLVDKGINLNQVIEQLDLPYDPVEGGEVGTVQNNRVPLAVVSEMTEMPGAAAPAPAEAPPVKLAASRATVVPILRPFEQRLRDKLRRILYQIRQQVLRDPARSVVGATAAQRQEWAKLILPCVIGAAQAESDRRTGQSLDYLDGVAADLDLVQQQLDEVRLYDPALETRCVTVVRALLAFLDETVREASVSSPQQFLGKLDQVAKQLARRTIRDVVADDEEAAA